MEDPQEFLDTLGYYALLNLSQEATEEDVRRAYRCAGSWPHILPPIDNPQQHASCSGSYPGTHLCQMNKSLIPAAGPAWRAHG